MLTIFQALPLALWIAAPVVLGGLTHVLIIRLRLFSGLAALPLDGGLSWRGQRIFGENKTLRGALVMIVATAGWTWLQAGLAPHWDWSEPLAPEFARLHPLAWGALAGTGYILGELPNSFVKRQLGIAVGETRHGWACPFLWAVDQLDSLAGVLLLLLCVWTPPLAVVLALALLTLVVHPAVALVMYLLGLKSRIG